MFIDYIEDQETQGRIRDTWWPISAAPKNGTEVIVYAEELEQMAHPLTPFIATASYDASGGWHVCLFRETTHWCYPAIFRKPWWVRACNKLLHPTPWRVIPVNAGQYSMGLGGECIYRVDHTGWRVAPRAQWDGFPDTAMELDRFQGKPRAPRNVLGRTPTPPPDRPAA